MLMAVLLIASTLDDGHVYSTYAETLLDRKERAARSENLRMMAWAIGLNYAVFILAEPMFLYYIWLCAI